MVTGKELDLAMAEATADLRKSIRRGQEVRPECCDGNGTATTGYCLKVVNVSRR